MKVNRRCVECNQEFKLLEHVVAVHQINRVGFVSTKARDRESGATRLFAHLICPDIVLRTDFDETGPIPVLLDPVNFEKNKQSLIDAIYDPLLKITERSEPEDEDG